MRFILLSVISNNVSKIKLNFTQLIPILIIYFSLYLIMYYLNIFGLHELLKFLIILILSLIILIYNLNSNELKIVKNILLNFINK